MSDLITINSMDEIDWNKAPKEAKAHAFSNANIGYWYNTIDIAVHECTGIFTNKTKRTMLNTSGYKLAEGIDWRTTLTKRPKPQQPTGIFFKYPINESENDLKFSQVFILIPNTKAVKEIVDFKLKKISLNPNSSATVSKYAEFGWPHLPGKSPLEIALEKVNQGLEEKADQAILETLNEQTPITDKILTTKQQEKLHEGTLAASVMLCRSERIIGGTEVLEDDDE